MARSLERTELVERQLFVRTLFLGFLPPDVADANATSAAAAAVAESMRERFQLAGTTIYGSGDAARHAFFITHGEVQLVKEGEPPLSFKSGDVVGIMDIMQNQPYDQTAIARTDVRLLAVPRDAWLEILEDNFEFLRGSIVAISGRLRELILRLAPTGGFPAPGPRPKGLVPNELRTLSPVQRLIALKQVDAFRSAPVDPLMTLVKLVEERWLDPADVLFRIGEPTGELFAVVNGEVEITRDRPEVRASFVPGALVGGFAPLGHEKRIFTARAKVRTRVLRIRSEDYFDLMEDHFEVARIVLAEIGRARSRLMKQIAALQADPEVASAGA